jgi:hypothetical protein
MSSEIGASKLAALGEEVAVDDMMRKWCDAADYNVYAAARGAWRRARARTHARRTNACFDRAANSMYNHAFSRTVRGKEEQ